MSDNLSVTQGSGTNVAADEAVYSGDTTKIQLIRQVHIDGAEGSKTVKELVRLEDAAHTSGDPGLPMLGVRQDSASSLAGTDGDYTMPIFDANGRQHVNVGVSALPTGASTAANQTTANTALAAIQAAVETLDNFVAGNEAQVDVVGALPAGTNIIGSVGTATVTGPSVGQTTSNATAQQLNGGGSIAVTNGVLVQALAANTNNVYIGGSGVTTGNGYELQPGQAVPFTVDNVNDLYVIGGSGSDKVCWNVL
jgi:hypothetical protein